MLTKLTAEEICQRVIDSESKEKMLTLVSVNGTQLACTIKIIIESKDDKKKTTIDEVIENSCLFSDLIDVCNGSLLGKVSFMGTSGSSIKLMAKK